MEPLFRPGGQDAILSYMGDAVHTGNVWRHACMLATGGQDGILSYMGGAGVAGSYSGPASPTRKKGAQKYGWL
jgi:hypothetical protein